MSGSGSAPVGAGIVFEDRMSDADALMWNIEKDPALRSTIVTVGILDGVLDEANITARVDRLSRIIPRLRQRVRSNPLSIAPPRWEYDPLFDIKYHVRFAKVPGDGTLDDLLELVAPIAMPATLRPFIAEMITITKMVPTARPPANLPKQICIIL